LFVAIYDKDGKIQRGCLMIKGSLQVWRSTKKRW